MRRPLVVAMTDLRKVLGCSGIVAPKFPAITSRMLQHGSAGTSTATAAVTNATCEPGGDLISASAASCTGDKPNSRTDTTGIVSLPRLPSL